MLGQGGAFLLIVCVCVCVCMCVSYVIVTVTNVFCADAKRCWLLYSGSSQGSGIDQCEYNQVVVKTQLTLGKQ
jgi:hypothetical protein